MSKEYTPEELELIRKARNKYQREYYQANKERCLEISRRSRERRKEKIKEYQNDYWLRKAIEDNSVDVED